MRKTADHLKRGKQSFDNRMVAGGKKKKNTGPTLKISWNGFVILTSIFFNGSLALRNDGTSVVLPDDFRHSN